MKRITGTHVYSFVKCPRLAALDLHLERKERREPWPWEEHAARRGREFEAQFVAGLEAVGPNYPERDFEAGAAATLELLRQGRPWIHQGVLRTVERLGLPDLLRRVPGASALGDHHYEVLDVKSSGRSRADQILQVVFYSRLLAEVQGRLPEHGALVLKDSREERFVVRDYLAPVIEIEQDLRHLSQDPAAAEPFLQAACEGCHWNHRCLPEMEAAGDLALLQGMSRGARAILHSRGCRTIADLASGSGDGGRGHLDGALLRRLRRAAQAALLGRPVPESRPRSAPLDPAVLVHCLTDPFADRVLAFGMLQPGHPDGRFHHVLPGSRSAEWPAWCELASSVPRSHHLLHFGGTLPRWYEDHAYEREADAGLAARFVDLWPRLRGAVLFPRAVFGLDDCIRWGLGRDPWRAGHAGAAAMWCDDPTGPQRLAAKLHSDLEDIALLKQRFLDVAVEATTGEQES